MGCTIHGVCSVFFFALTLRVIVIVIVIGMGDHLNLRGFYPAFDLRSVDERPPATDFFPHSGYDHDILSVHLSRLLDASRPSPLAQRGQSRKDPMIYVVGAREEQLIE
jgi:hypothetical protein